MKVAFTQILVKYPQDRVLRLTYQRVATECVDVELSRETLALSHEQTITPNALLRPNHLLLAVVDEDVHLMTALGVLALEEVDVNTAPAAVEAFGERLFSLGGGSGHGEAGEEKEGLERNHCCGGFVDRKAEGVRSSWS